MTIEELDTRFAMTAYMIVHDMQMVTEREAAMNEKETAEEGSTS